MLSNGLLLFCWFYTHMFYCTWACMELFLHTEMDYRNSQEILYLKRLFTNQNSTHLQRHFLAGDTDKPTELTALHLSNIQV